MTVVELVDSQGRALGAATVEEAHRAPGMMHRAFSVFLRDESGRVLLQQRAAVKTRFPLRWGNTCCGHPGPGEEVAEAAARRLAEEVGVSGVPLTEVGVYSYYAEDPATGRVEYEYDHVLVGDVSSGIELPADPDEVADLRWTSVDDLRAAVTGDSRSYAPWLAGVTAVLASAASESAAPPASEPATPPAPEPATPPADGSAVRPTAEPAVPPGSRTDDMPERSGGG